MHLHPPHVVGRNSAAPFPAKAENSAQAPFLPPLPTGPASLGSGGGPCFRLCRKEKAGRARSSSSQSPLSSVSALRRKLRPLPCSSSPHRTRSAGLRRGPQLKAAGAEFGRGGQIRPNAGVFSDGARKFGSLKPATADSVPPFSALPQL